jgi:hypothetical protein
MVLDSSTINGIIIITLVRCLDADNAAAIEDELKKIAEQCPEPANGNPVSLTRSHRNSQFR